MFICVSPRVCAPLDLRTACMPQVTHKLHDAKQYLQYRNNPLWVCPYMLTGYPWQPTSRLATSVWYCSPLCTLCDMHRTPWRRDTVTLHQTESAKVQFCLVWVGTERHALTSDLRQRWGFRQSMHTPLSLQRRA